MPILPVFGFMTHVMASWLESCDTIRISASENGFVAFKMEKPANVVMQG